LGPLCYFPSPSVNLGLIIVDEEHEHTYKQTEPAPRYHAKGCSNCSGINSSCQWLYLVQQTPSFESYYNALAGKTVL